MTPPLESPAEWGAFADSKSDRQIYGIDWAAFGDPDDEEPRGFDDAEVGRYLLGDFVTAPRQPTKSG